MLSKKPGVDIVNDILEECILAYPLSSFIISVYKQYLERGSLSKKQLQGLYAKAQKLSGLPEGRLATLEAVIKKMPTRYKSELPPATPSFKKDDAAGELIGAILNRYPQHKRVLFFKAKFDNNEPLSVLEMEELKRFSKLLSR